LIDRRTERVISVWPDNPLGRDAYASLGQQIGCAHVSRRGFRPIDGIGGATLPCGSASGRNWRWILQQWMVEQPADGFAPAITAIGGNVGISQNGKRRLRLAKNASKPLYPERAFGRVSQAVPVMLVVKDGGRRRLGEECERIAARQ